MMKYMMVLIGYMFYTVPSGLCLYIIASSLWGITEKKLLPKTKPATAGAPTAPSKLAKLFSPDSNGSARPAPLGQFRSWIAKLFPPDSNGSAAAKRDRKKQRRGK